MGHNRHGATRTVGAVLLGILTLALAVGLFTATPARAQTYPIISGGSATTTTTVEPTTTTVKKATGGLAFTGADITVTMGAAAACLGVGGALVLVSRKRKAAR